MVEGTIRRVALEVSFRFQNDAAYQPQAGGWTKPRAQYAARLLLFTSACRCRQDRTYRHRRTRSRSSRFPLWGSGIHIGKLRPGRICRNIGLS